MVQKILIFKLIFIIFLFYNNNIYAKNIIGKAKVIDGDTIHIEQNKIRLYGIDAPEKKQKCLYREEEWECGKESANYLRKLILNTDVECEIKGIDKYKRYIGICFLKQHNINKLMVKNGWAIAYRYYSKDYISYENTAKKNKSGIWKGEFVEPYKFRKKNN